MNSSSKHKMLVTGLVLLGIFSIPGAFAGESDGTQRCVHLNRIDSIKILNKSQIAFEMKGDRYFVNSLPHPCPGLRKDSTIMYRTSLNELCNVDVITVLDNFGGAFQPGASCGLGTFQPVMKSDIEALRQAPKSRSD